MKKLIESFTAQDSNGKKYKIDLNQPYKVSRSLEGDEILEGLKEYSCGASKVTNIDDETFHIISIDTKVKKIS